MKSKENHNQPYDPMQLSEDLLSRSEISFPDSKEHAWQKIEAATINSPGTIHKGSFAVVIKLAATVALLVAITAFLRFYHQSYQSGSSVLSPIQLNDGTIISLKQNTSMKVYPLWWKFSRNIKLEGTASFDVSKGNAFKVQSVKGMTEVLGTKFTIDASSMHYRVSCFEGSVKVSSTESGVSAIISANEKLQILEDGRFEVRLMEVKNENPGKNINENDYITFKSIPVRQVFKKIENIFAIDIVLEEIPDLLYTGNLARSNSQETIIRAICLPLDLEYEQISATKYRIFRSTD